MIENSLLLNFTSLNKEQLKMILRWRNDPQIKKWMFTQEDIKLEDHLKFVSLLKSNKAKQYFLVQHKKQYIGVIDFCEITPISVVMGVYKNPELFNVGKQLLQTILEYAFDTLGVKTIYSEVFEENKKALELYYSFGFKSIGSKIINSKKVITMELTHENR